MSQFITPPQCPGASFDRIAKAESRATYPSKTSKPNMSAVAKVFTTVELLEAILLELPMKDILRAQQVCKHWKQVIAGSNAIKKALFMRPGTAAEAAVDSFRFSYTKYDGTTGNFAINPWVWYKDDRIERHTQGIGFSICKRTMGWRTYSSGLAQMSITQPPLKLVMYISHKCGNENYTHVYHCRQLCGLESRSKTKISTVFKSIRSAAKRRVRKLKNKGFECMDSSVLMRINGFKLVEAATN
ncbi:hypothetical protein KC315_g18061 [Hortaea werneckii]|nr:hypothetical protein KC315_g18061 [Hortaea werneckii]